MAFISASTPSSSSAYNPKGIYLMVGFVCIAGFLVDMLILSLPPNLGNIEWRVGLMQQFSSRSIIFLFGTALVIMGSTTKRARMVLFSRISTIVGLVFLALCLLSIADAIQLQQQAINTISSQESQLQTRIRDAQNNPAAIGENITAEDLRQASQLLTQQADTLKQNAKSTVIKTGASNISNLLLAGLGLVGIGRYGMTMSRTK